MTTDNRFETLDIFRGLTIMLMILVNTPGSYDHVYPLMAHAPWEGCTLADLVFPFFLYSVGFSGFLSCRKHGNNLIEKQFKKIIERTIKLFILGIIFNMFPYYDVSMGLSFDSIIHAWTHMRVFGILQRIACAYALGILLCLALKSFRRIGLAALILLILHTIGLYAYAPAAPFAMQHNLSQAIDIFIPGAANVYQGFGLPFDPEGLYGTLSAAASVMIGYLAGSRYCSENATSQHRNVFVLIGLSGIAFGYILSFWIPICKALWTFSYVLLTSGIAITVMNFFLIFSEHSLHYRTILRPLHAFGTNPLFFFFISAFFALTFGLPWIFIQDTIAYDWAYANLFLPFFSPELASLLFACIYLFLCWIPAEVLYRRNIIIKV